MRAEKDAATSLTGGMPVPAQQRSILRSPFFTHILEPRHGRKQMRKPRKEWRQNRKPTGQFHRGHKVVDPSAVEQGKVVNLELP